MSCHAPAALGGLVHKIEQSASRAAHHAPLPPAQGVHLAAVKTLLKAGASVAAFDREGNTALHHAALSLHQGEEAGGEDAPGPSARPGGRAAAVPVTASQEECVAMARELLLAGADAQVGAVQHAVQSGSLAFPFFPFLLVGAVVQAVWHLPAWAGEVSNQAAAGQLRVVPRPGPAALRQESEVGFMPARRESEGCIMQAGTPSFSGTPASSPCSHFSLPSPALTFRPPTARERHHWAWQGGSGPSS